MFRQIAPSPLKPCLRPLLRRHIPVIEELQAHRVHAIVRCVADQNHQRLRELVVYQRGLVEEDSQCTALASKARPARRRHDMRSTAMRTNYSAK